MAWIFKASLDVVLGLGDALGSAADSIENKHRNKPEVFGPDIPGSP
jgi:hypothetical protein